MTTPVDYGNPPGQGSLRPGGKSLAGLPETENNLPSKQSKAVEAQMPALTIMRDLAEGNERVKEKTTAYLPMELGEDPTNYSNRLKRSVFTNYTGRAIEGYTGLVFSKDPQLGQDVPAVIAGVAATETTPRTEGHWENIDLAGTHGDVFLRERFADQVTAGHGAILVDYPNTGGTQSAADERDPTFPIRPYWVPILKDNIVSWRTATVNGKLVLSQIVIKECTVISDGAYGEKELTQYRVLNRLDSGVVTWRLERITEHKAIQVVDGGVVFNQNEIPIAELVTSGKKSMFVSKPPLLDLAYLNLAHYQQDSDYRNSIHLTCVPIYVETGVDPDDTSQIVMSANRARRFTNPEAKAMFVSHDGASLASCRQALEDLKSDMGTLSIQMLAPDKRAAETATAKRIDKAAGDSALGVAARGLQDGIERALYFHARYLKLPSGGSIQINRDFDASVMDAQTMVAYGDLAEKLGIPVRTILEELQAGGRFVGQDLDQLEADIEAERAARDEMKRVEAEQQMAALQARNGGTQQKAVA